MQCIMLTNGEYCTYLYMLFDFLCSVMILQTKRTKKAGIVGKYGRDTGLSLLIVLRSCSYHCILIDDSFVIAVTQVPGMVPVYVNRSRRWRSPSTPSTSVSSVAR
jgi:hypothetical protein